MAGKAFDAGKSLLDLVLAKLPENLRTEVAQKLGAPEATDAITLLGDSALARSDYSTRMDEITAKEKAIAEDYDRLNTWFTENKAQLDKAAALEKEVATLKGGKPPVADPTPTPAPSTGMTKEDLEKLLQARDESYAGVLALSTTLATKHLRDFNEVLDMNELVSFATSKQVSLADAYKVKFADKIAAKAKEQEDARINQLVEVRLAEVRKQDVNQPFPLRNQSPSVLDVLTSPTDKPANHTLDTAVAEYERLTANA